MMTWRAWRPLSPVPDGVCGARGDDGPTPGGAGPTLQSLLAAGAATTRSAIDTRGLGRPEAFEGTAEKWRGWSESSWRSKTFFGAANFFGALAYNVLPIPLRKLRILRISLRLLKKTLELHRNS